jgi:O-antigen ligase
MTPFKSFLFNYSVSRRIMLLGCFALCLAVFCTPLSTSLMGMFSVLAVCCWLLSGRFLSLFNLLKHYPAALISLLFFLYMCVAITYSPAEVGEGLNILKKYRELLLLPICVSMFSFSYKYREIAEYSFFAGCLLLMAASYCITFGILPEQRYGHSIVFHITHNFFMAVLSFWSLHYAFINLRYRWLWLTVFFLSILNIFYIAPGRTGMLVFSCLMILFIFQRLSFKKCLAALLFFCAAITAIYWTSDNFSGRIDEVISEIENYQPGKSRTSIGQRFDWYQTGILLVIEKPLLGHGTGSYPYVQKSVTADSRIKETDNPHNEFLFLTIQFGLLGLVLFFSLLVVQLFCARSLPASKQMLLQGVILAIVSGSLVNSLLFDSQQGHFYLFMSAALMSADSPDDSLNS